MRIATRIWLGFLFAIVLVLGLGVLVRLRQEQRVLLEVTLRDRRFFAYALHTAISHEHGNSDPLAQARQMLDREEVADEHIVARLVSISRAHGLPKPRLPPSGTNTLIHGQVIVTVLGNEILTYIPLRAGGDVSIELAEPQAVRALLAQLGFRSLIIQAIVLASLGALVTFVLLRWLVGAPLGRLARMAREIGAGDLSVRANLGDGDDEVSSLAREMNKMTERLQATLKAYEEVNAERVTALDHLRHADRLRTVGEIASSLAHELGTPLNVISGHARMIEDDSTDPNVRGSTRTILEQTSRMTRIIKDLLDLVRRRSPAIKVQDPTAIARHAVQTLEPLTKRYQCTIEVQQIGTTTNIRADAQQMMQVLTNLLMNAMQFMPKGGMVRVLIDRVHASPPTGIHAPAGEYVRISVIDQGAGIDPKDIPKLFEPFFTRRADGGGTGLGLSVVDGIVRDHKGWVSVQSELGRGSRFEVLLPAVTQQ